MLPDAELLDIIGKVDMANYATYHYTDWENNVAIPALIALGYSVIGFRDGERDSLGPLTRLVDCWKDGRLYTFIYG
jgi:hypothetical protein